MTSALGGRVRGSSKYDQTDMGEGGRRSDSDVIFGTHMDNHLKGASFFFWSVLGSQDKIMYVAAGNKTIFLLISIIYEQSSPCSCCHIP